MSGRRGFLAFIGGATVTGSAVVFRKAAAAPTLILPPSLDLAASPPEPATGYRLLDALAERGRSQMHAFLDVKAGVPDDLFLDWLEGGLRMVEGCKPGGIIHRAMQAEGRA